MVCLGAAIGAQSTAPSPLAIQVFESATTLPSPAQWVTSTLDDRQHAALQYTSGGTAGTVTLLYCFAVPDPDFPANQNTLQVLRQIYPFIDHPTNMWRADDPALTTSGVVIENEADAVVVIPPARVRAQVDAVIAAGAGSAGQFGPLGTTTAAVYTRPTSGPWPGDPAKTDERWAWSGSWDATRRIFDIGQVGRRALDVAAFRYSAQCDETGVANLADMIRQTYQWMIEIQAVQLTPLGGGNWKLRLSEPVSVRRRSLGAQTEDPWLMAVGPERELPSILFAFQFLNLAGYGELLIVKLAGDHPGLDLLAHVPLANGGWAALPRLEKIGELDLIAARPSTAVFSYPWNGIAGTGYVSKTDLTPVATAHPLTYWGSASFGIYPFVPVNPVLP